MNTRFNWDYPSQGLRIARSSAEAFGPYEMMPLTGPTRRARRRTMRNYAIAAALTIATILMLVFH